MKAALLLMALLAGPAHHEMTAGEATAAANREVHRVLPRLDRGSRTIRTDEDGATWRVFYESRADEASGGPVIFVVDKRTRRARIVQMPN